jgi:oligopeptide/dipeptide ABC transporter ATP-binding protein
MESGPTDKIFFNSQHTYTNALLSAVPDPDPDAEFKPIRFEGDMIHPVASNGPDGVSLRIPDQPSNEPIQLVEVEEGHFVACHLDQHVTTERTKALEPA